MKNKAALSSALFASVIFFMMPIFEKILMVESRFPNADVLLSAGIIELFIFAIPVAFLCKFTSSSFFEKSKIALPKLYTLPFTLASTAVYFLGALLLLYIQVTLLPHSATTLDGIATVEENGFFRVAFVYVFVPAIAEELFFRSVLLTEYGRYSGTVAVFMSSLFFAMLHFSLSQFFIYFILGLILGSVTYVTESSLPAVIMHLIYNGIMTFSREGVTSFLRESSSSIILAFLLIFLFLLSLVGLMLATERLYEKRSLFYSVGKIIGARRDAALALAREGRETSGKKSAMSKFAEPLLSPTFFLAVALFFLVTFEII